MKSKPPRPHSPRIVRAPLESSLHGWLDDTLENLVLPSRPLALRRRPRESVPEFAGYEVHELVGEGSFGSVYRASDQTLDREVAIKVLSTSAPSGVAIPPRERLLNEARSLARVSHRNVPVIYSVLEAPEIDRLAIVIEFIRGRRLSEILEQRGPFGEHEAAEIGIELCKALGAIHGAGLIHRDIKTDNILREDFPREDLREKSRRVVLTDFGLSVAINEIETLDRRRVAGSPLFMAPEQIRGDEMGPWTDIYGLGVTLYNLTSGSFPIVPSDFDDLVSRIKAGDTVPLDQKRPELPARFLRIVRRCLARDLSERYRRVEELENDLRDVTRPVAAA